MGIQKAIVAFIMSALALAAYFVSIDFTIEAHVVESVVGIVLTLGNTFGVWRTTNTDAP